MTKTDNNAKIVREMITHEGNLINHRLTWLTTLQGFLFAALAFAWKDAFVFAIPIIIVGFMSSVSVLLALKFAVQAIGKLLEEWDTAAMLSIYDGPDVIGFRSFTSRGRLLLPWFMLPRVLAGAWLYIAIVYIVEIVWYLHHHRMFLGDGWNVLIHRT